MIATFASLPISTGGYTVRHAQRPYHLRPAHFWYSEAVAAFESDGLMPALRLALGTEQFGAFQSSQPSPADADALLHACFAAPIRRQRRRERR